MGFGAGGALATDRRLHALAALLLAAPLMTGCVVGPDYTRPSVETPLAYKQGGVREDSPAYVAARRKGWREARPSDAVERGDWWRVFKDPALDRLIRLVDVDNQSLRQAVANYRQARALVASAQAALYPTVIGAPSITRTGSGTATRTNVSLLGQASWELDLFGGTRRTIESEAALAQSDAATIALTRLSIQAEIAADYLTVRYADSSRRCSTRMSRTSREPWRSPRTSTPPAWRRAPT